MPAEDIEYKLMKHGFELRALKDAVERGEATAMDIRKDVDKLQESQTMMEKAFNRWQASAEATENYARDITSKAITLKQFYVGVGALLVSILALALTIIGVKG